MINAMRGDLMKLDEIPVMKERVINAAVEEFGKSGLKFTMDDVAKNLGISKKTLYKIYDSKEEMLLDVADYSFADIKKSEHEIVDDEKLDTLTKIRRIMIVLPERYQNRGLSKLYTLKDKYPSIYQRVTMYLSTDWDATIRLLEQGIDEGVIRPVSIPVLRAMVESTFKDFVSDSVLVENGISYEDALDEMIEIVINGIKAN